MKHIVKPSPASLNHIVFTEESAKNRVLIKNVLLELVNLDTALEIMSKTLTEEEYIEYIKYFEHSIEGDIERIECFSLSDSLKAKIDAYANGSLSILKYIVENRDAGTEESDPLFYCVMEIFEESVLGLHSPYAVQFLVFSLVATESNRTVGFISFLCNNVHSTDQRRELMAIYIASFIGRVSEFSADALAVVEEYIEMTKQRILSIDDKFTRVLLSGLYHIQEKSGHKFNLHSFLSKIQIEPLSNINYPFDPSPIEAYNRLIENYKY